MQITAIIDYGSGNIRSVAKAFERAASVGNIHSSIQVTSRPQDIKHASRIVLPGVGAFRDCKLGLDAIEGLREAMEVAVINDAKPFLGICVGMQLMADLGLEHDVTQGLGWIKGEVKPLVSAGNTLKVPHMGWNTIEVVRTHALLSGIETGDNGDHAYFVHSYQFQCANREDLIAVTHYGSPITAIIGKENLVGTQFHPEKSQDLGLRLIQNFLSWYP